MSNRTGFYPADILLPKKGVDYKKWSVVACDQFTSQPDYWEETARIVGDAPSALHMILPECYLQAGDRTGEIERINAAMQDALHTGVFETYHDAFVYVERTVTGGKIRRGLVGRIDLEQYDYQPGAGTLVRATERTVLERIPPRVKIREGAPLELPHVMLLIDDPGKTVIEPLAGRAAAFPLLYDFDLMQGAGHIRGYLVDVAAQATVESALEALMDPLAFQKKYHTAKRDVLLYAVGDGNHSLASAKACYEAQKKKAAPGAQLLSRYALVELVNLHDDSLQFEPIHRVVFGCGMETLLSAARSYFGELTQREETENTVTGNTISEGTILGNSAADRNAADRNAANKPVLQSSAHAKNSPAEDAVLGNFVGVVSGKKRVDVCPAGQEGRLAVAAWQEFLDVFCAENHLQVDYIHGDDAVLELCASGNNTGLLLPAMGKSQLFQTVIEEGALPRKTFSMGHASDKRFYLEARRIR